MDRQLEIHCRDDLRTARAAVQRDAEAFPEVFFAIERTGASLIGKAKTLGAYKDAFRDLARRSALVEPPPSDSFDRLYDLVTAGRNDALHQGAFARNLAAHAIELALILEDALVNGLPSIKDYMVRGPVVAEPWQPLRVVRHTMLANSFSFLPISLGNGDWRVISDLAVARVLRQSTSRQDRSERLAASIEHAVEAFGLHLETPIVVGPDALITDVLAAGDQSAPVLITAGGDRLLGIATPFDLL